jgi:hypothetical protein
MNIFPLGPSGGPGGGSFNDIADKLGGFTGLAFTASIAALQVNAGDTLDHLIVTYTENIGSVQHGASNGGAAFPAFVLGLPGEKLTQVHGWLGTFSGTLEVQGFNFVTNTGRQSGVLGKTTDLPFEFFAPANGEIMAFWGREGLFFDACGVFVRVP